MIPCLNEERFVGDIVARARRHVDHVIVVDDGSSDGTEHVAREAGAEVVRHERPMGAGAATRTGFEAALKHDPDVIVTLDGDGQHNPDEIPQVAGRVTSGEADLVIGSRFLTLNSPTGGTEQSQPVRGPGGADKKEWAQATDRPGNVQATHETLTTGASEETVASKTTPAPGGTGLTGLRPYRKFGIDVITWLYNFGSATKITDSQSCFRAHSGKLLEAVRITEDGFGFSVEMLVKARRHGFRINEVPISCVYHDEGSTIHPVQHGLGVAAAALKLRLQALARSRHGKSAMGTGTKKHQPR